MRIDGSRFHWVSQKSSPISTIMLTFRTNGSSFTYYSRGQGWLQGAQYSGNCKACLMLCKDGIRIVTENRMRLILSTTKEIISNENSTSQCMGDGRIYLFSHCARRHSACLFLWIVLSWLVVV